MAAIESYARTRERLRAKALTQLVMLAKCHDTVAMSYSMCASQSSSLICMDQEIYYE